ncbi:MAG: hypothetical protein AVDCRST_MAG66-1486 [uncultured Pseudonocardia sp.]|uniref:Uncharacterized protein n=1 Tax=uncultured Pseudonocardia sp. TaxID=211455 RepID=A0A6J4P069_9PSEU|nr:MAG: hypothetical protein AVDCRST_MAG66-1486 [uncultured Pseudonocardia sp.]
MTVRATDRHRRGRPVVGPPDDREGRAVRRGRVRQAGARRRGGVLRVPAGGRRGADPLAGSPSTGGRIAACRVWVSWSAP